MRDIMLILHFIGLVMGLGTGFAHAFLGAGAAKLQPDEAKKFRLNLLVLSNMGHIGIALLIISGFYLITPFWKILWSTPLLLTKLALVIILIVLISRMSILARKAKRGEDPELQFKKMSQLGKFTLLIGVAIVVLAIKIFH